MEIVIPDEAVGYVCKAVLQALKGGSLPTDEEAFALNKLPLIKRLRETVSESDLDDLLGLARNEALGPHARALFVSLTQSYCTKPKVAAFLKELFLTSDPLVKARIVWRLADSPDLEPEWHGKLQEFVRDDWDAFVDTRGFQTGGVEALEKLLSAPKPTLFPDSKRWVYLSLAIAMACTSHEEKARVRALVTEISRKLPSRDRTFLEALVTSHLD